MTNESPSYHGYRFPPEIISHAVWLYYRFGLSFRDTEDLLAQRNVTVTYEMIRRWCRSAAVCTSPAATTGPDGRYFDLAHHAGLIRFRAV